MFVFADILENFAMPYVISFPLDQEFVNAQSFCETFNLNVSFIEFLGLKSIIFFDELHHVIFRGWAGNRLLMLWTWY